jgi:hypothetical protein
MITIFREYHVLEKPYFAICFFALEYLDEENCWCTCVTLVLWKRALSLGFIWAFKNKG